MILALSRVVRIIVLGTTPEHAAMKIRHKRICLRGTTSCAYCGDRQSSDGVPASITAVSFCGQSEREAIVKCVFQLR